MNGSRRVPGGRSIWTATAQLLLATAASAQGAGTPDAAGDDGMALQEVTVTATRREESQSKVPISISAFTQKTLDDRSVRSIDDIARLTPGVQFDRTQNAGTAIANISIRGISSPDAGSGATGIYVDDTPIQSRSVVQGIGSSAFPAIFDLERVEVLRGPQGTLFGAGSEGGTVRFITPQPSTTKFSNYSRADVGFTAGGSPSFELGTAFNFPLSTDKAGLRVSASHRRDGGYVGRIDIHNGKLLERDSNWSDTKTFRAALAFKVSDTLTITPSFYYQNQWFNDSSVYWEDYTDPVTGERTVYSRPDDGVFNRGTLLANYTRDNFTLPAVKVDWDLGSVRLISNTSYFDRDQVGISDLSSFEAAVWTGNPIFPPGMYAPSYNDTSQKTFTQEVRLQSQGGDSRLTWVVGAFYQRARQHHHERVEDIFLPDLFFANTGLNFDDIFPGADCTGALHGQDRSGGHHRQATGVLRATGLQDHRQAEGDRRRALRQDGLQHYAVYAGPIVGPIADDSGSKSTKPVTPKGGPVVPDDGRHAAVRECLQGLPQRRIQQSRGGQLRRIVHRHAHTRHRPGRPRTDRSPAAVRRRHRLVLRARRQDPRARRSPAARRQRLPDQVGQHPVRLHPAALRLLVHDQRRSGDQPRL